MTIRKARPVVAFIPPACCGAGYFRRLRRALVGRIDFRAVELPGRGHRYQEPGIIQAELATKDIAGQIGEPVDAIYGESLGAYLGLGVVAAIEQAGAPLLLVASNSPPSAREKVSTVGVESIEAAITALTDLGGDIPDEVAHDPKLAGQAYPLIRDDLYLSRSLIESLRDAAVTADIQVLVGESDTTLVHLESWAVHTTGSCEVIRLAGGHLLSRTNPIGVAGLILEALAGR